MALVGRSQRELHFPGYCAALDFMSLQRPGRPSRTPLPRVPREDLTWSCPLHLAPARGWALSRRRKRLCGQVG